MNEGIVYDPFKALLGYIWTATSEGMKRKMIILSDMLSGCKP